MVKKISTIILALGILVSGYFAQRKLNFWEKSIAIFKLNTEEQLSGRGMGRDHGGFAVRENFRQGQGRGMGEGRVVPDSIRMRFEDRGEVRGMRGRNLPDSLLRNMENRRFPGGRMRQGEGFGPGESGIIKKVNLRNIQWHMAIFASLTVIVIYIDKGVRYLKERSNRRTGKISDENNCPEIVD